MLSHIYIRDFAIIEELDLELNAGTTALTGETGAGKSILIDAIGLVLGDRADSGVVRHGASKAEITLSVDIANTPHAKAWLQEQALDDDDTCILRRVISAKGHSRAWINGSPCNLTMLRQLGEQLVDIHGQHEHQSLMKKDMQRILLDDYAKHQTLQDAVAQCYQTWKQLNERLETLSNQSAAHQERIDLLKFQSQELAELQLVRGEIAELDEEYNRLSNAEQLIYVAENCNQQLYQNDQSIYSQLSSLINDLENNSQVDAELNTPKELLINAQIQIQEAADFCRHYLDSIELDPERLQWAENRVTSIQSMARKYRVEPEQLIDKLEAIQAELKTLDGDDYNIEALQEKLAQAEKDYQQAAEKLTASRLKAAKQLAKGVSTAMQELGMQGGKFEIALLAHDKFSTNGNEQIEFQVSANPGQPLKPLIKVASGGELSRISLAIQMIAAQKVTLPALIFDEVDTGIGGGTAEVVGKQLRKLGEGRQVLCVTHLPQVAAQAHNHYKVTKIKGKDSTSTGMVELNKEQRIDEVARMIGGVEITDATRDLAKELLDNSN